MRPDVSAKRAAINERAGYILNTYGDSILRYAYSYLHNMSDAEDILQDTLIQYLKTGPVFENAAHEKAWLLRVAANLSKNRLDYNSIRKTDELNEELAADERDELSFVWEAVKSLPFTPEQTEYISYWHELARIDYTGEGKTACYRKAAGTEDCSGDYNVYTDVTEFEAGSTDRNAQGGRRAVYSRYMDGRKLFLFSQPVRRSEPQRLAGSDELHAEIDFRFI